MEMERDWVGGLRRVNKYRLLETWIARNNLKNNEVKPLMVERGEIDIAIGEWGGRLGFCKIMMSRIMFLEQFLSFSFIYFLLYISFVQIWIYFNLTWISLLLLLFVFCRFYISSRREKGWSLLIIIDPI